MREATHEICPSGHKDDLEGGAHLWLIHGNPRSAMTYYVCCKCDAKRERGPGLFYEEPRHA